MDSPEVTQRLPCEHCTILLNGPSFQSFDETFRPTSLALSQDARNDRVALWYLLRRVSTIQHICYLRPRACTMDDELVFAAHCNMHEPSPEHVVGQLAPTFL